MDRAKAIHDELEVDIAAYCKHQLNMRHKRNSNGFNLLFKGSKAALQSIVAHNIHENVGMNQQGGMSLLLFGHLTEQLGHNESGKDETGLGRWVVMTLQGDGVRMRVVCGYSPCGNSKLNPAASEIPGHAAERSNMSQEVVPRQLYGTTGKVGTGG